MSWMGMALIDRLLREAGFQRINYTPALVTIDLFEACRY